MKYSGRPIFSKIVPGLLLLTCCLFSAIKSSAQTVTYYRDVDGDGWGTSNTSVATTSQPTGYVLNNHDCNDNNSNASIWTNTGATSFSQYGATHTVIALDASGIPYVLYNDNTSKASVQKYTGGAWSYVGSQLFSNGPNDYNSMVISSGGTPYVAFRDNGYQASMMRYNGSSWVYLGGAQFTPGGATYVSMALGTNDTPFIAFKDSYWSSNNKASVMKFDGTSWSNVGIAGFSAGDANWTSLAVSGTTKYCAYSDNNSSGKVTVMKSTGGAWTPVGSAGFSAGSATYISIVVDNGGTPYVAYSDAGNSNKVTVMRYNGASWVLVGTAGLSAGTANYVTLTIDASKKPIVAYQDVANSNKATVMKFNGTSWANVISAGFTSGSASYTDIALSPYGVPYVAYQDASGKISVMNQALVINYPTTPVITATPSTTCTSGSVTLTVTSGTLNDATAWKWYSGSCGGTLVGSGTTIKPMLTSSTTYYARGENSCPSSNGVCAFVTATLKANSTWYRDADNDSWGSQSVTTSACTQPAGYVGNNIDCNDAVVTNTQYYALGSGAASTMQDLWTTIAVDDNNVPYIGFYENFFRGSVMKFSGGNWSYVGSSQFTAGATQYNSIAIDGTGTPYMAYQDGFAGTSVMKYNGSNWVYVGSQKFSAGGASYQSLAIDPSNTPYVAYNDAYFLYANKATVMMYNGISWVPVGGTPGVTSGAATYISLAIDGGGTPYIAYCDAANSSKATVMKYNGNAWVVVGAAGFSAGSVTYTSLAIDATGTPYVAYSDGNSSNKATVMKYDGASWVLVGSAGFTSGSATYASLAVSGSNLYVSYSDGANSNKATVMRYNGSSWSVYGNAAFSTGAANYTSVAVDSYGIPVTAFQDNGVSSQAFAYKAGPVTTAPTTPTVGASNNPVICGSGTTLTATGTLNGAGTWYWYSGSCGGTFLGTGNSIIVYPTSNTTYYARGDGGCLTTPGTCGNVTVNTTASSPIVANISGPTIVCEEATSMLADATPGGVWSTSNTLKATAGPTTGVVYGVASGSVTITYTVTNGCGTAYKTYAMTVNSAPSAITGGTDVCEGSTVDLNASGTGTWSSSNTSIATVVTITGITAGISDGSVNITYTLSSTGCYKVLPFIVDPQPSPIYYNTTSLCIDNTTTLSNSVAGGTWSSSIPANATVDVNTGLVTPITGGNTIITYGLPGGCTSTLGMTVNATPTAITGTTSACAGASSNLASSGSGVWSSSNTSIATVVAASGSVTGVSAGTVTISYIFPATGCGTAKTFTVLASPSTISGITSVCVGFTTNLSNTVAGGTWSSSATDKATVGLGTGMVTGVASGNTTITYSISSGCKATAAVVVDKVPSVSSVTNTGPICAGATLGLQAAGPTNVISYLWTGPAAITNANTNSASVPSATTAASGTYTVTVSSGGTGPGCSTWYTTTATVNATPTAAPTNNGPKCGTGSVILTANPGVGVIRYSWSGPSSFTSTLQNPAAAPATTSVYSLTVANGSVSGCSTSVLYTTTVVVNSVPTAAPTNNGPICSGGTITLSANPANGANGYTWSGPNLSSTTVQNPTATPTVTSTYSLIVRYGNGLPGCSPLTVYTTTVTVSPGVNWLGTVSTDWFTAGNWCGGIPGTTSVVTIPNGTTYYPIISSGTASVRNITIASAAKVTLTGGTIQVSGNITTAGTFSVTGGTVEMNGSTIQTMNANLFANNTVNNFTVTNPGGVSLGGTLNIKGIAKPASGNILSNGFLTLLSTSTQTALVDASGTGVVSGNMIMQRYLPKGFGYKYVSSPFTAATVGGFAANVNLAATFPTFYYYDENKTSSGWTSYTTSSNTLNVLKGFAANFGTSLSPQTFFLTGIANNGALSTTLYNHNYTYTLGFNLVGNPYPSPIDWTASSGWTKTNIDNAIYYFNASDTSQYTGSYSSYIAGVSSDGIANNIIPSMQGFFIHVSNGTYPVTATFGMNNSVRVTNLSPVYHRTSGSGDPSLIRLDASFSNDGSRSDPAVVYFVEHADGRFNNTTDALKLSNTDGMMPNLYSLSADEQRLSIQAIQFLDDSTSIVPLGVQTERDGQITFNARDINEMPAGVHIYFYDTRTGAIQDMRTEPKYNVNLGTGKHDYRFYLMFTKKDKSSLPVLKGDLNAYTSGKSLFVYVISGKGDLVVTNMLGQTVTKQELSGTGYHEIKLPVSAGIYIATFYSNIGKQSKKIFIGND